MHLINPLKITLLTSNCKHIRFYMHAIASLASLLLFSIIDKETLAKEKQAAK
jgi:hypothetical protein